MYRGLSHPTYAGISLCLAVLLQFQVAGRAIAVQNSTFVLSVAQLQSFGVTADCALHVSCLEQGVSLLLQGGRVLR